MIDMIQKTAKEYKAINSGRRTVEVDDRIYERLHALSESESKSISTILAELLGLQERRAYVSDLAREFLADSAARRKAIAGSVAMTGGQITGELTGDEYNRLIIRAQTENKQFGAVLLEHAAETTIRTRMTPRQCSLIVAGAALEDVLDLEPGSLLDPVWVSFVSPSTSAAENVANLTEGFDMATEPTPGTLDRVQGIITAALDRTGTSESEAAA
jgi:predicted CopG family antitoxin